MEQDRTACEVAEATHPIYHHEHCVYTLIVTGSGWNVLITSPYEIWSFVHYALPGSNPMDIFQGRTYAFLLSENTGFNRLNDCHQAGATECTTWGHLQLLIGWLFWETAASVLWSQIKACELGLLPWASPWQTCFFSFSILHKVALLSMFCILSEHWQNASSKQLWQW